MKRNLSKPYYILVFTFVLLFGYQNCSTHNFGDYSSVSAHSSLIDESFEPIDLSQENIQKVGFRIDKPVAVNHNGKLYNLRQSFKYEVDLSQQRIKLLNDETGDITTYCLTDQLYEDLRARINGSKLCKYRPMLDEDSVCAQQIIEPYSTLVANQQHFFLGAAIDSCGSERVDLCDQNPNVIKEWISALEPQLDDLICQ